MSSPSKNKVPLSILFPEQDTEDEDRMDYLFAEFPLNPRLNLEQYNNKMEIWKSAVFRFCFATNSSVITFNGVASVKFQGKSSLALYTCWEKLLENGTILRLEDLRRNLMQSWSSWTLDKTIVAPLKWIGRSLFSSADKDSWKSEKFVHMKFFLDKCDVVVQILRKRLTCGLQSLLIPYFDLAELSIDVFPSEEEFELALLHLQSKKMLSVFVMDDGTKIVKFCSNPGWGCPKVTKEELAKIELEKSLAIVKEEISKLNGRLETVTKEAVTHGKEGKKHKAFRCLKLKHIIEKDLEAKLNVESNLEKLLSQFEDQKSLSLVINAMKNSAQVIKKSALSMEDVDKTIDDVEDVLALDQTINDAMSSMNQRVFENAGIFDADLEKELEQLENEVESPKPLIPNGKATVVSPPKRKVTPGENGDLSGNESKMPSTSSDSGLEGWNTEISKLIEESPKSKMRRATESRVAVAM